MAKMDGKYFHVDCLKCLVCAKSIDGKCSRMGKGFLCSACAEHVRAEAARAQAL